MNSRERVIRAIEMTGPDRVPMTHSALPGAARRYGKALEDICGRFPSDVLDVGNATSGEFGSQIGVPSEDTWGSLWLRLTEEHKGQVVHFPLADWGGLGWFRPPDTAADDVMADIEARLEANAGDKYAIADGDTLWQRMFYLHGYEATLEDLLLEPDRCCRLRDLILSVMVRRVERLCCIAGLEGIHFRDDWGTQEAMMTSPALWREMFKPAYARLFLLTRDAGKHVWFHSDGVIDAIIPDLIEIGVNVLNPQVAVMGRERVASLCAGKICIQGDIDRQWVLPYGSPDDVREAVRADVASFGSFQGGYILCGQMAGDVPLENLVALLEEATHSATDADGFLV